MQHLGIQFEVNAFPTPENVWTATIGQKVGYCDGTPTFKQLVGKKKFARGFCLNAECLKKNSWRLLGNSIPGFIDMLQGRRDLFFRLKGKNHFFGYSTQNKKEQICKRCKHALYWSKQWQRIFLPAEFEVLMYARFLARVEKNDPYAERRKQEEKEEEERRKTRTPVKFEFAPSRKKIKELDNYLLTELKNLRFDNEKAERFLAHTENLKLENENAELKRLIKKIENLFPDLFK